MSDSNSSRGSRASHESDEPPPPFRWEKRGAGTALLAALSGLGACEPIDDRDPPLTPLAAGMDGGVGGSVPLGSGDAAAGPQTAESTSPGSSGVELGVSECPNGTELCNDRCISTAPGSCCNTASCGSFEQCNTDNTCGCQATAVNCNGTCRAPGSCCANADCGGDGVGTCGDNGACSCLNGAFGARCAGRFVGLGVARPQDNDSEATDISGDGSVVIGWSGLGAVSRLAARWLWETSQVQDLGPLPNSESSVPTSVATAVSHDGSVVVGDASTRAFGSEATVPFRWSQAGGLVALPAIDFSLATHAEAVTSDGATVLGWGDTEGGAAAGTRWRSSNSNALEQFSAAPDALFLRATTATGSRLAGDAGRIPVLFDPAAQGAARFSFVPLGRSSGGFVSAVNANSTQFVGVLDGIAVRWLNSSPAGTPSLGNPQDLGVGVAVDVSNGGIVVGNADGAAVVWNATGTQRTVLEILQAAAVTGLSGWSFTSANGISDDGLVIVGAGTRAGRQEAWLVKLPQDL